MKGDLYPQFPTLNQRQLGEHFGVTSHVVGRWLKSAGLREPTGQPSPAAIEGGFVEQVDLGDGHPFWAWRKKTVPFLEEQGHLRPLVALPDAASQTYLVGPFIARSCGEDGDGHEVVDANGTVGVWVRGEDNAKAVVALMNLGHQYRGLWK